LQNKNTISRGAETGKGFSSLAHIEVSNESGKDE